MEVAQVINNSFSRRRRMMHGRRMQGCFRVSINSGGAMQRSISSKYGCLKKCQRLPDTTSISRRRGRNMDKRFTKDINTMARHRWYNMRK